VLHLRDDHCDHLFGGDTMSLTVEQAKELRDEIATKLSEISRWFPMDYRFSLVARDPSDINGGLIVSDDDYLEVAEFIQYIALGDDRRKIN
jgi:hypothetical protein